MNEFRIKNEGKLHYIFLYLGVRRRQFRNHYRIVNMYKRATGDNTNVPKEAPDGCEWLGFDVGKQNGDDVCKEQIVKGSRPISNFLLCCSKNFQRQSDLDSDELSYETRFELNLGHWHVD